MSARRESLVELQFVTGLAKDLVMRLAMLLKTARMHSVNNAALRYSVKIYAQSSNDLLKHLGECECEAQVESMRSRIKGACGPLKHRIRSGRH